MPRSQEVSQECRKGTVTADVATLALAFLVLGGGNADTTNTSSAVDDAKRTADVAAENVPPGSPATNVFSSVDGGAKTPNGRKPTAAVSGIGLRSEVKRTRDKHGLRDSVCETVGRRASMAMVTAACSL